MREKKKILMSSLAMLLLSILTLTSVTFAWFTSGDTATVSGVEFQAQASEGIQISVGKEKDGSWHWGSTINAEQLKNVEANETQLGTEGNPGVLAPVSTTVDNLKKGELFKGTVTDTTLTAEAAVKSSTTDNSQGYYAFDLYFRNDGASAKKIYLDTISDDKKSTVTKKDNNEYGLENAARVAFAVVGSNAAAKNLETTEIASSNASSNVVIWEPNATDHTGTVNANYSVSFNGKLNYYGVSASGKWTLGAIDSNGTIGLSNGTTAQSAAVTTSDGSTANIELFTIPANQTTKITVFIWIEGQDVDCINYASAGSVATNLQFKAETVTE